MSEPLKRKSELEASHTDAQTARREYVDTAPNLSYESRKKIEQLEVNYEARVENQVEQFIDELLPSNK
jgi:hypothetical protein